MGIWAEASRHQLHHNPPALSQTECKPGAFHPLADQIQPQGSKDRQVTPPHKPQHIVRGIKAGATAWVQPPRCGRAWMLVETPQFFYRSMPIFRQNFPHCTKEMRVGGRRSKAVSRGLLRLPYKGHLH